MAALKGIAETHLGLARSGTENQRLCRARDNLQETVDYLTIAIAKGNELCCLWKLLGDATHLMAKMPQKYCYLQVPPAYVKLESEKETVEIQRSEMLQLSVR